MPETKILILIKIREVSNSGQKGSSNLLISFTYFLVSDFVGSPHKILKLLLRLREWFSLKKNLVKSSLKKSKRVIISKEEKKWKDCLTSLAADDNLFLMSVRVNVLDGPACDLSFPGV